jgi:hypothetical protein
MLCSRDGTDLFGFTHHEKVEFLPVGFKGIHVLLGSSRQSVVQPVSFLPSEPGCQQHPLMDGVEGKKIGKDLFQTVS